MTTYPHGYQPGSPIHFSKDPEVSYIVAACDERYIIATGHASWPADEEHYQEAYDGPVYTICDLVLGVRGPDNMIFSNAYITYGDCEERLAELQSGLIKVSERNSRYVELDIVEKP